MGGHTNHGRELVRSRSLAVRMAVLIVAIPVFVVAAVAAMAVFLTWGWLLVLAIAIGGGSVAQIVTRVRRERQPLDGHLLERDEDPELFAMVDRMCALIDIEAPEIVASELRQPNSWVIHRPGKRPRLFITRRLREMLMPEELQAVVAHELTHIANRDALVMTITSTPGSILLNSRGGGLGQLAFVVIGGISSLAVAMLSRYRELAADAGSAAITGRPSALAAVLLKVADAQPRVPARDLRAAAALNAFNLVAVPPVKGHWVARRGPIARAARTHPDLDQRIEALHRLEVRQQSPAR
jgi:heat shock protein HtpX